MSGSRLLAGTALLETLWNTRQKDLIDLISPFIHYCTADKVSPSKALTQGNKINITAVTKDVRRQFGYEDIPPAVIERVYKRDGKHYKKSNGSYYLVEALDDEVAKLEKNRQECVKNINSIGKSLLNYLQSHCQREKVYTEDQAIDWLQKFFCRYAVDVGTKTLNFEELSKQLNEVYYWIGRYIYEERDVKSEEYNGLIKLIKGYYLQAAIYIQPDTDVSQKRRYENVNFYYDTPFLIDLLGWQSEEGTQAARELHHMLQEQGASAYYFPQMEEELISILRAYQCSIGRKMIGGRTLQALDENGFTHSNVDTLIERLPGILENKYHVHRVSQPAYLQKANGDINNRYVIDEASAKRYVEANTKHYKEQNLENDIMSAVTIHKMRGSNQSGYIEYCGHVLVTNNVDLTRAFNAFYKKNVSSAAFSPIIDTKRLASLTWITSGKIDSKMAELDLLENAYAAMQPTPELLERFSEEVIKLEKMGRISQEEALAIRADKVVKRELALKMGFDVANVNSESTRQLVEEAKGRIVANREAEINQMHQKDQQRRNSQLRDSAHAKAVEIAGKEKRKIEKRLWIVSWSIITVFFVIAAIGCVLGFNNAVYGIPSIAFAMVSLASIYDMRRGRKEIIKRQIEKYANKRERKIYDLEYQKYMDIIGTTENVAD